MPAPSDRDAAELVGRTPGPPGPAFRRQKQDLAARGRPVRGPPRTAASAPPLLQVCVHGKVCGIAMNAHARHRRQNRWHGAILPGATKPFSEGAALAVAPARQIVFGGSLLYFVVARRRPLGDAAFLQALQEAATAARFEHEFLLFGQLLGGLEALPGNRGSARPDEQAEVAERREISGGDGAPLADLNFGADAGGFDLGALAIQTGQICKLLFVADLLEFELDATPVEGLFEGESEGLHRFTGCICAGTTSRRSEEHTSELQSPCNLV